MKRRHVINLVTPRRYKSAGSRTGWLRGARERRRSMTKSEMRGKRKKKRNKRGEISLLGPGGCWINRRGFRINRTE
jgi:hypothetical protein